MTPTTDSREPGSSGRTGNSSTHEPFMAEYLTMFLREKRTVLRCLLLVTVLAAVYMFINGM